LVHKSGTFSWYIVRQTGHNCLGEKAIGSILLVSITL